MILDKLAEGYSFRQISEEYEHSTGTLQSRKKGISRKQRAGQHLKIDVLCKDVEMYPDAYQHERAVRFNCTDRGIGIALKKATFHVNKEVTSVRGTLVRVQNEAIA